jgi:hypothetical protein
MYRKTMIPTKLKFAMIFTLVGNISRSSGACDSTYVAQDRIYVKLQIYVQ